MALRIRRLSHALGAEVIGADLGKTLDTQTFGEIYSAFLEHCVLVFREQPITRDQHVAFSRMFGDLEKNKALPSDRKPSEYPEIALVISKPKPTGEAATGGYPGQAWHSDKSFTPIPSLATVLRGVELPEVGGNTMFASGYRAYETLSDGMKKLLDGLHGVHDRENNKRVGPGRSTADQLVQTERITRTAHPIVRVHPETGRKALFLGKALVKQIVGMTVEESAPLLQFLHEHATRPQFVYRHVWQKDDLVMWDNRCLLHLALSDYDRKQVRHMEKTNVLGTPSGYAYDGPLG